MIFMYRNILLGIDGEEHTLRAMEEAIGIASAFNARLVGLHVRDEWILLSKMVSHELYATGRQEYRDYVRLRLGEKAQRIVAQFEERAGEAGIDFDIKIRGGKPAEEFLEEASSGSYDLAVLGSKELKNRLQRLHSYRLPEEVQKKIGISLLIVR